MLKCFLKCNADSVTNSTKLLLDVMLKSKTVVKEGCS